MDEDNFVTKERIGIWGCGLIGYTLALALAEKGVDCLITDVDPERVRAVEEGRLPFVTVDPECIRPPSEHARLRLRATTCWETLLSPDRPIQVICVSTEREGKTDSRALEEVARKIASIPTAPRPLFFIIESTIAPTWSDRLIRPAFAESGWDIHRDLHIGCSPRRDWYVGKARTIESIPKIIGGDSEACISVMRRLYSTICKEVFVAPDERHAAAVKLIENFYRYNAVLLANRLAGALPDFDVSELLRLASSKWNQELYHPSLGIGGYCLPLAKDYLAESFQSPEHWPVQELDDLEEREAESLYERLFPNVGEGRRVVVLGLAYAPNLRIHARSPSLRLARFLVERGWDVRIHDPLYTSDEVSAISGISAAEVPEDIPLAHTLVVMTGHKEYREDIGKLRSALRPGTRVIDNLGTWRTLGINNDVCYIEVGSVLQRRLSKSETSRQQTDRPASIEIATLRAWLHDQEATDALDRAFSAAAAIAAIDRPYIRVEFDGEVTRMPSIAEKLDAMRCQPASRWSDAQVEGFCGLALLGMARLRLEYVGLELSLPRLVAHIEKLRSHYAQALSDVGLDHTCVPSLGQPWWHLASALVEMRRLIDRHYFRIARINGENWHREELLLRRDAFNPDHLPDLLARRLIPFGERRSGENPEGYLRRLAHHVLTEDNRGRLRELFETIMLAAAEDPLIEADHTTLLAPRGTRLDRPWEMDRDDFLAWVVFRESFRPEGLVGDTELIQRAMLAHHSVKKKKTARKYLAKYGTESTASLEDDLGALGIYFNESAHHRGHQISGIQSAMRLLMAIEVMHNGGMHRIEGLTDFRVTRTTPGESAEFSASHYPVFIQYSQLIRTLVEVVFSNGLVLPPTMGG